MTDFVIKYTVTNDVPGAVPDEKETIVSASSEEKAVELLLTDPQYGIEPGDAVKILSVAPATMRD